MNEIVNYGIENRNGILVVSSRVLAKVFGKEHKHILETIDKLVESNTAEIQALFIETYYVASNGKKNREYLVTETGFTLYVMNIQGYVKEKLNYIATFNRMKAELEDRITTKEQHLLNIMKSKSEVEIATNVAKFNIEYIVPLEKKEEYHDNILDTKGTLTVSQIANDYGKSARWLNKYLANRKIQYKKGNQWYLYQEYKDKGYAREITIKNEEQDKTFTNLRWTNKGRKFIYNLLAEEDILPIIAIERKDN